MTTKGIVWLAEQNRYFLFSASASHRELENRKGPGGSATGNVFVAKTPEAYTYDADGNLTADGRWTYAWDLTHEIIDLFGQRCFTVHGSHGGVFRGAMHISRVGENRLINLTSGSSTPTGSKFKMDFAYDWKGRRIEKQVSTNNGTSYFAQYTNRFVYDDWNLVAILMAAAGVNTGQGKLTVTQCDRMRQHRMLKDINK